MDKSQVSLRVNHVVNVVLGIPPDQINNESSISDDLGADSLDAVELMMGIEEEFDLNINEEEFNQCETVGQIVDFVAKKLSAE